MRSTTTKDDDGDDGGSDNTGEGSRQHLIAHEWHFGFIQMHAPYLPLYFTIQWLFALFSHTAAIVGGVIGGLIVLAFFVIIIFLVVK